MPVRVTKKGILFIDFTCYAPNGKKLRCRESLRIPDNKQNRKFAKSKWKGIEYELKHGNFNYLHFFPNGSKAKVFLKTEGSDMLFSDLWEKWIADKSLRPNTERSWQSVYNTHLKNRFAFVKIGLMCESELIAFRKTLEEKLAASTINDKIMKLLDMAFIYAVRKGYLIKNPAENIKRLFQKKPDINPFSFEELKFFLKFLLQKKPRYYNLFLLWSETGLRPSEMYALKWANVDYFNRKLLIRETRSLCTDGLPKTQNSIRDIDLSDSAIAALKQQEEKTKLQGTYIFTTEEGKPLSEGYMRKVFKHLLKLAGLRERPISQIRHTYATLRIAAGENVSWVSRMLGHSDSIITMRYYNRFIPNLTRQDGSAYAAIMEKE